MLKSTHFGACSDAMQQVHGAGVKSNILFIFSSINKRLGEADMNIEKISDTIIVTIHSCKMVKQELKYEELI